VLGVPVHQQKGRFKVVWIGEPADRSCRLVGLQSLNEQNIWDFPLPLAAGQKPGLDSANGHGALVTASPNEDHAILLQGS